MLAAARWIKNTIELNSGRKFLQLYFKFNRSNYIHFQLFRFKNPFNQCSTCYQYRIYICVCAKKKIAEFLPFKHLCTALFKRKCPLVLVFTFQVKRKLWLSIHCIQHCVFFFDWFFFFFHSIHFGSIHVRLIQYRLALSHFRFCSIVLDFRSFLYVTYTRWILGLI